MKRCRVLLVDDLPEIIEYCKQILKADHDIVGTATNGARAIAAVAEFVPDVIVLDISMPGMTGIEVAHQLRNSGCQAVIVFLSADDEMLTAGLEAGGSAYVSKRLADPCLPVAIAEGLAGRQFVAVCNDVKKLL